MLGLWAPVGMSATLLRHSDILSQRVNERGWVLIDSFWLLCGERPLGDGGSKETI